MAKILAIDDDQTILKLIAITLQQDGHDCLTAGSAAEAMELLANQEFELVLVDIHLPGKSGLDLIDDIKTLNPDAGIMMVTGVTEIEVSKSAADKGAWAYLTKPFSPSQLIINTINCLRRRELELTEKIRQQDLERRAEQTSCALQASEIRFQGLVETMREGLAVMDRQGLITYVNDRMTKITGQSRAKLIGRPFSRLFREEDRSAVQNLLAVEDAVNDNQIELPLPTKDGHLLHLIVLPQPIFDADGNLQGCQAVITDITERKAMEEEIRLGQARLDSYLSTITAGIMVIDGEIERIVEVNPAMAAMIGADQDSIVGRQDIDFARPRDQGSDQITNGGQETEYEEYMLIRTNGDRLPVLRSIAPVVFGREQLLIETYIDITNLTEAKKALQESEANYRALVENSLNIIMRVDTEGRITFFNDYGLNFFGYTAEELIGRSVVGVIIPEIETTGRNLNQFIDLLVANPEGFAYHENENIKANGERCWIAWTNRVILDEKGNLKEIFSIGTDMTKTKALQDAARRDRNRLMAVLEASPDPLAIFSRDHLLEFCNRSYEELFGWQRDELLGRPVQTVPEEEAQGLEEMLEQLRQGNRIVGWEAKQVTKGGRRIDVSISIAPLAEAEEDEGSGGLVVLFRDMTEHNQLSAQLQQAQKLESIGQLAAGIAHEINTPIQYIGDNTRFLDEAIQGLAGIIDHYRKLKSLVEGNDQAVEFLAELEEAEEEADLEYLLEEGPLAVKQSLEGVDRVATIVRAMKEFSHPGTKDKTMVDINQALSSTVTVARNEYKYVAELDLKLDSDLPAVEAFPGELNQVFLNLIVNAAHAIGDVVADNGEKGLITITTSAGDDEVIISIADTGAGIPEQIRHRIFDHFFTTKDAGRGTGQGLAIAYSVVVDMHGGRITFDSEMGKGTEFQIRLPRRTESEATDR